MTREEVTTLVEASDDGGYNPGGSYGKLGFWIYFEGNVNRICQWMGCGA